MKMIEGLLEDMLKEVREMLAATKLLRARVESNDEVMRLMQNSLATMQVRLEELDRRITKIENHFERERRLYRGIAPDA